MLLLKVWYTIQYDTISYRCIPFYGLKIYTSKESTSFSKDKTEAWVSEGSKEGSVFPAHVECMCLCSPDSMLEISLAKM